MKKTILWTLPVGFALILYSAAGAAEHPAEHPKAGKKSAHEHPQEHPQEGQQTQKAAPSITTEDLAKSIADYVQKDSALKGGYFLVYDPVNQKTLQLTLDKVHKDRLSKVSENTYFACADFKTPDGALYDLDVFMVGQDAASLQATEVSVHKENGKARYGWVEERGIWKKKAN